MTGMPNSLDLIKIRHDLLSPILDEKRYRIYLAAEAKALGRGGVSKVALATGASRKTVSSGLDELIRPQIQEPITDDSTEKKTRHSRGRLPVAEDVRQRQPGGGRKRTTDIDSTLKTDLDALLEPFAAGNPCSPLRWTCKTISTLTAELVGMGHKTSTRMVHELLIEMRYTMQSNRKTKESGGHPDRPEQFRYINDKVKLFQDAGEPVISVCTKKKKLVDEFTNKRSWRPEGCPEKVNTHAFLGPDKGGDEPYGIYDGVNNGGFVNVGTCADSSAFAVESIRRWWFNMGQESYADAKKLLITADGGGGNGSQVKLCKTELQRLADEIKMEISVCHFPPGTSKWNKIEHRMFSSISMNWHGKPLVSIETMVSLIGATKTNKGANICTPVGTNEYTKGMKITDAENEPLALKRGLSHGEWNYTISPK